MSAHLHADGHYGDILAVPGTVAHGAVSGRPLLTMEGNTVFKFAVKVLAEVAQEALSAHRLPTSAIDWLILHQANLRIIQAMAQRLNMPMEKVVITLPKYGNTSAASIPMALDEAARDGRIKENHLLLFEAFGGGLTWASALVRW